MRNYFVQDSIVKEIGEKSVALQKHPFELFVHKQFRNSIDEEANMHSYKIEEQAARSQNIKTSEKDIKKGIKNLEATFRWGCDNFSATKLDEQFIKILAGKIDPEFFQITPTYRQAKDTDFGGVRPSGATWTPPYPEKIPQEMEKFVKEVKEILSQGDLKSVIEGAIYAHLHLVRIHPFEDGNGRTARTMQNIILRKRQLPPPIIYAGERHDYYAHLDSAINDWRNRVGSDPSQKYNPQQERAFYNYMAGKISASLDRMTNGQGKLCKLLRR